MIFYTDEQARLASTHLVTGAMVITHLLAERDEARDAAERLARAAEEAADWR